MSQTQVMSTAIATEILQSVSVEITVFVITVALAVALRGGPLGKAVVGPQKKTSGPPCKKAVWEDSSKPAVANGASKKPVKQLTPQGEASSGGLEQKVDLMVTLAVRRQSFEALAIYEELRATGQLLAIKGELTNGAKSAATDAYSSLVQCAGKAGRPELVEILLDDMKVTGIDRPLKFYESAMKMLASKKAYKEAISVCGHLESDGHEPSPVTLSCLINFAAEIGDADRAIGYFARLAATSTPSIRACMTILRVYSKRSDWRSSVALIWDMQKRGAPIDSLVLNIVLATGVAAGEVNAALALLKEFSRKGLGDVVSFNTVMKGLAHQKEADAALKMLQEMSQSGVAPNAITFNTAMDAAVRSLRVADAWGVLVRMLDAGLTPDKFTCTTLLKGLQSGATSEQLSMILDFLKSVAKECDSTLRCYLFRNVIEATARVNDPDLTAKAVAQMREQRVILSAQEYQQLLKVLLKDGDASSQL